MGFCRQEYWSGLPFPPPPGDLSNPGIEPASPALASGFFTSEPPGKLRSMLIYIKKIEDKKEDKKGHFIKIKFPVSNEILIILSKITSM